MNVSYVRPYKSNINAMLHCIQIFSFIAFKYSRIPATSRRMSSVISEILRARTIMHCRQIINYEYLYTCDCIDSPDYRQDLLFTSKCIKLNQYITCSLRCSIFLGSRTHRNALMKRGIEICQLQRRKEGTLMEIIQHY